MSEFTIDRVSALLRELGERLAGRGIEGEIYVVGGAAMMLAYDRTRITRDIDAVGVPQEEIDAEVRAIHHAIAVQIPRTRLRPRRGRERQCRSAGRKCGERCK